MMDDQETSVNGKGASRPVATSLNQLRSDVQAGLDQLDRGDSVPGAEVFRRHRQRNLDSDPKSHEVA